MLLHITIFLTLFLLLYFLGRQITQLIHNISLLLTKNKKISLSILLIFLLPGTIIHELSHFIVSTILFVPVGKISILPKIEDLPARPAGGPAGRQGEIVKAGSMHHADTDIVRRTAIGLAPIIIGLILIYLIGQLFLINFSFQLNPSRLTLYAFISYLLSLISLSMFSSKKDLETTWFLAPILIIAVLSLYVAGFRLNATKDLQSAITHLLSRLNTYLFITAAINLIVFFALKGMVLTLEKILRRRVVSLKT
ncbi:hypothetical protein HYW54_02435 [Candidatus Gottesmanbacteria bacterium]|nr:hypothetical protein [Candidatus Gottesmanbacteria bacterium]